MVNCSVCEHEAIGYFFFCPDEEPGVTYYFWLCGNHYYTLTKSGDVDWDMADTWIAKAQKGLMGEKWVEKFGHIEDPSGPDEGASGA